MKAFAANYKGSEALWDNLYNRSALLEAKLF